MVIKLTLWSILAAGIAVVLSWQHEVIITHLSGRLRPTKHNAIGSDTSEEWGRVKDWDLRYHLGGYGPYVHFDATKHNVSSIDHAIPQGCQVEQVHMLARHTERYPTVTAGMHMLEIYHRIAKLENSLNGSLAFTERWSFFTGKPAEDFEQLTSTGPYAGTMTAFKSGVDFLTRYRELIREALHQDKSLSIWASDSQRVIDTAKYFSSALAGPDWQRRVDLKIISEAEDKGADTLTPGDTCLKYANDADDSGWHYGSRMVDKFLPTYLTSTQQRLLEENPEFPLSIDELYVMQEMCAFEVQCAGSSSWCDVFTHEEWDGFEYARDLLHFYRSGPGNPYAATMGWLWLNATANLLAQGADAGRLFLSFVHDGDILPMLTSLELFPQAGMLPTSHIDHDRTWRISDTVPMGARITFELLTCDTQECWSNEPFYPNHIYCTPVEQVQHVRILVNDHVVPLPGCQSGPGHSCPLKHFLQRIATRGKELTDFGSLCGLSATAAKRITFLHQ